MSKNEDLAALLEADTLDYIRTESIFLVSAIALFGFTARGKTFSIISLLIALLLNITLVVNYYIQRSRVIRQGFQPKNIIEVLMVFMIFVIFFILWILYEVWFTEPSGSIENISKEIEDKIDKSNAQSFKKLDSNLEQIQENRKMLSNLTPISKEVIDKLSRLVGVEPKTETVPAPNTTTTNTENNMVGKILDDTSSNTQTIKKIIDNNSLYNQAALLQLEGAKRQKEQTNKSVLAAAVS